MTFREKLQMEHPWMNETITDVVIEELCPCDLGYEIRKEACHHYRTDEECIKCWNREMPNTELENVKEAFREIGKAISKANEDVYKEDMHTAYNKGLNDAWEWLRNVTKYKYTEMMELYGHATLNVIVDKFTPQEALAKLKAYEDSKIEVGDVVKDTEGYEYVVTNIYKDRDSCRYNGVTSDGKWTGCYEPTKTGKHIDISSILEQIGE